MALSLFFFVPLVSAGPQKPQTWTPSKIEYENLGNFWKFFRSIFLEEIFGRNFLGEIFLGGFFGRFFFAEVFLGGILCLHWNWLVCQDFVFCQDFVSMQKKEGRKISIVRSARASSIALKNRYFGAQECEFFDHFYDFKTSWPEKMSISKILFNAIFTPNMIIKKCPQLFTSLNFVFLLLRPCKNCKN